MNLSELPATTSKMTLLCHQGNVNVRNDLADCVEIGPEQTIACSDKIDAESWAWLKQQPRFMKLLRLVFLEKDFPDFADHPLQQHGMGLRHVVGLILLMLSATREGKRTFIRFPESYLHPAQQVGLGDLLINISN